MIRMKKRLLIIVVVIIMLLIMTAPVIAAENQGKPFQDFWNALGDLRNQITALTQRVDDIQTCPMPEYRAGSYTTPPAPPDEPPVFWGYESQTVTFSHPMPDTNYRVSITYTDQIGIVEFGTAQCSGTSNCILTIDSKSTTGFIFRLRDSYTSGIVYKIGNSRTFDYIAIADN